MDRLGCGHLVIRRIGFCGLDLRQPGAAGTREPQMVSQSVSGLSQKTEGLYTRGVVNGVKEIEIDIVKSPFRILTKRTL